MNPVKPIFVHLEPHEKLMLKDNSNGLSVFLKALTFEKDIISSFISELDAEKQKERTCTRIRIDEDVLTSLSRLRSYLSDNFAFNPTTQELYWLTCRYLSSKFPGYRDFNLT